MEFMTYSRLNGFNMVEADTLNEAESSDDIVVLDELGDMDPELVDRIRHLLDD